MIMGKSEVELKKQSKTKRRKNQKMELKEKWICPNAEVQLFTPQEYVAMCYVYTYSCLGSTSGKYLYRTKDEYIAELNESRHTITISTKAEGQSLPRIISGGTKDNTNSGNNWHTHPGYYFYYDGKYHFGTDDEFILTSTNNVS